MSTEQRRKFDINYLNKLLLRDKAILIGEYNNLNRDVSINFICNCGKEHVKNFKIIAYKAGAFCEECTGKNKKEKYKQTNLDIRGVENPMRCSEVKEKLKQTCIKKFDVENPSQSKLVKERKSETCMKNHGVSNPLKSKIIRSKAKQTNLRIRGVEHPMRCSEVKEKCKQTNLRIRGVENPSQCIYVQKKKEESKLTFKEYVCPSGTIRRIQGYENFALDELFKKFTEDQVITDRETIPSIEYYYEDRKHVYFPDIFIPHLNKIIEVKSTWTYNLDVEKLKQKEKYTKLQGYEYEYWIFDKDSLTIKTEHE
jgi:hypothetical protein